MDRAPHGLNESLADRKPKSGPFGLCRKERQENPRHVLGADPFSIILYRDFKKRCPHTARRRLPPIPTFPFRGGEPIHERKSTGANLPYHHFEHPALGGVTVLGSPVHLDGDGFTPGPPTAAFGSEASTILAWAGFTDRDVDRLLAGGAVTPTVS